MVNLMICLQPLLVDWKVSVWHTETVQFTVYIVGDVVTDFSGYRNIVMEVDTTFLLAKLHSHTSLPSQPV